MGSNHFLRPKAKGFTFCVLALLLPQLPPWDPACSRPEQLLTTSPQQPPLLIPAPVKCLGTPLIPISIPYAFSEALGLDCGSFSR